MGIAGTGVDIVEIARIAEAIDRFGGRLLHRLFTAEEIRYCSSTASPAQHFAARFALKEAVLKALGTGLSGGIQWREIEVVRNQAGMPGIKLSGAAAERASAIGVNCWHISVSHAHEYAVAQAIGEREN